MALLLILSTALVLASCGSGGGSSRTTTPTNGSIAVTNGSSSYSIVELYIAKSTDTGWGVNQLSSSISANSTRTITDIPAGTYDLLAVFSNSAEYERYDIVVTGGQTYSVTATPATSTSTTGSVAVTNGSSSYSITELYISLSSSGDWGVNQITSSISAGSVRTITGIPAGTYDLKAVFSNSGIYYRYSFTVTAGQTYSVSATPSTPTPATGSMFITNNSSYPVPEVYIVPASSSSWGTNQISSTISAGGTRTITGIPAGSYDFAALLTDYSTYYYYTYKLGFSITAGSTYSLTIANSGLTGSIKIVNNSSYSITGFYAVPDGSASWGSNILSSSITAGSSRHITDFVPGNYDIRIVRSDGMTYVNTVPNPNYIPVTAGSTYSIAVSN